MHLFPNLEGQYAVCSIPEHAAVLVALWQSLQELRALRQGHPSYLAGSQENDPDYSRSM